MLLSFGSFDALRLHIHFLNLGQFFFCFTTARPVNCLTPLNPLTSLLHGPALLVRRVFCQRPTLLFLPWRPVLRVVLWHQFLWILCRRLVLQLTQHSVSWVLDQCLVLWFLRVLASVSLIYLPASGLLTCSLGAHFSVVSTLSPGKHSNRIEVQGK